MFGDGDLTLFFADTGVPVQWHGEPVAYGLLDAETDVFSHGAGPGGVEHTTYRLRIPYNAFSATPRPRDAITVDGAAYTVSQLPHQSDLQVIELVLKKA